MNVNHVRHESSKIGSFLKQFENPNWKPLGVMQKLFKIFVGILLFSPLCVVIFIIYTVLLFLLSFPEKFYKDEPEDIQEAQYRYAFTTILHFVKIILPYLMMFLVNVLYDVPDDAVFSVVKQISQKAYLYDNNFVQDVCFSLHKTALFIFFFLILIVGCVNAVCIFISTRFNEEYWKKKEDKIKKVLNNPLMGLINGVGIEKLLSIPEFTVYALMELGEDDFWLLSNICFELNKVDPTGILKYYNSNISKIQSYERILFFADNFLSLFPITLLVLICFFEIKMNQKPIVELSSQVSKNKLKSFKKYCTFISDLNSKKSNLVYKLLCFVIYLMIYTVLNIWVICNKYKATLDKSPRPILQRIKFFISRLINITFATILVMLLMFGYVDNLSHLKAFIDKFEVFSYVFNFSVTKRAEFQKINQLHLKIDKYYIVSVAENLIKTTEDEYFVMHFLDLINNNCDGAMKLLEKCKNPEIKLYIEDEIKKIKNVLFEDIDLELNRDYVKIKYNGYYYTFDIDKSMFIRLFGDSGTGKSTLVQILSGYIVHNHSSVEGVSNGKVLAVPISEMSDDSKLHFAEYGLRDTYMFSHLSGNDNYAMANKDFDKIMKDINYFEDLDIEKYKCLFDVPYKYWITSSGQESKLSFFKTLLETAREDSFLTVSDELLANIGDKDKEIIIGKFMKFVNGLNKKTTAIFTDHSNIIEALGWYNMVISIENKGLVPKMKNKDGKYVAVDTFFSGDINSMIIDGITVTRTKIDKSNV